MKIKSSSAEQRYLKHYEQKLTRTLANGSRQQPPAHFELKAAAIRRNNTFKIHLMNDEAIQIQGDSGRVETFVIYIYICLYISYMY